ncbi:MAG: ABC transporter permease [Alphaproteobacteria bacterium]
MTIAIDAHTATLTARREGDALSLVVSGCWSGDSISTAEADVGRLIAESEVPARVTIDASAIDRLDTLGGSLLDRLERSYGARGIPVTLSGLQAHQARLYDEVREGLSVPPPVPPAQPPLWRMALDRTGITLIEARKDSSALIEFFGAVVMAGARVVTGSGRFRFAAVVTQFERVCYRAVPIILLITFLIGAIIAQQGIFFFRRFGAESYVVDLVGILTMREIGVLIVSIMVAGRTGSAFTAELGSMKMREEIDALRVMGLNPIEVLVLPRMIALIVAVPILTFLGNLSAIFGASIVSQFYGNVSIGAFYDSLLDDVSKRHLWVGLIKAPFMALMIGLIACVEGLRVAGSAESLGAHTTSSVVKAIFLVIVMDGAFAIFFASIQW